MTNRNKILVFDVETTGLLPKKNDPYGKFPYIIQLSFVIYDTKQRSIENAYNYYINPPADVQITPEITALTGITRQICEEKGSNFAEAIQTFYDCYCRCGYIVAHNNEFDITVIKHELSRHIENNNSIAFISFNLFNPEFEKNRNMISVCTMRYSIDMCNIWVPRPNNPDKLYKKFPSLRELYMHLFHKEPANLHNSLMDVCATLRCFLKAYCCINLTEDEYQNIIEKIQYRNSQII